MCCRTSEVSGVLQVAQGGGDASFFSLMGLIKYEFNNSTVI